MASNYWENVMKERVGRRRILKSGAALSVGAAALALIGCGSDATTSGDNDTTTPGTNSGSVGEPKTGGRYGDYFSNVSNYNVVANYHDGYRNSGITAYDRLITARIDSRGYVLGAAASVEVSEPTKIVFKLKPDMVYQDKAPVNGRKVRASDIVATQNYVKALPNAENSGFQRNYLDRVEAPDDTTVIYYLKSPLAYALSASYLANATAQPIIPEEMLSVLDTSPAVGSGPFELVNHTFNTKYNYKRFVNFREKGKPYFDEFENTSLVDAVAQEAAFRSEQIHRWEAPGGSVDRLMGELDKVKFANMTHLAAGWSALFAMNNKDKGGPRPWNDIRVREAFYRLMNRQQIIDLTVRGKAVVPAGPIQASLEAYQLTNAETEKFYKNDVAAAKQLLSAASYDTGKEWEVVTSTTNAVNAAWAEVLQQQFSEGGIKVRVTAAPLSELLPKKINPGAFDLWVGGTPGGDTPYRAIRNQHSDTLDQFNNVGLFDKAIDALIEKSEIETDREENIKLVKQIQLEALKQYSLSMNLLTQQVYTFYSAKLQNFEIDPLAGQVYRSESWFA